MEFPSDLRTVMEVEKRHTSQITARLTICSTAISSVEVVFFPISTGEGKEFVDGIKVYLRAAIGQFAQSEPRKTPRILFTRLSNSLPPRSQDVRIPTTPTTQASALKTTWDTVAPSGLGLGTGQSKKAKTAPPIQKAKSANPS